jgi:hypothetical protein
LKYSQSLFSYFRIKQLRVLVCGGRGYNDYEKVKEALDALGHIDTIIHGAARGADTLAGRYAEENGIPCSRYPALWSELGRSAGYERNERMLRESNPDLVVAFPGGHGTFMMKRLASEADVKVIEF